MTTKEEAIGLLGSDDFRNLLDNYSGDEIQEAIDTLVRYAKQEPVGLDEAAKQCAEENAYICEFAHDSEYDDIIETYVQVYKSGVEWMAKQGYTKTETVQNVPLTYTTEKILGVTVLTKYAPSESFFRNCKDGDKVVVQIRKENV